MRRRVVEMALSFIAIRRLTDERRTHGCAFAKHARVVDLSELVRGTTTSWCDELVRRAGAWHDDELVRRAGACRDRQAGGYSAATRRRMLPWALRRPRDIGGGSGSARAIVVLGAAGIVAEAIVRAAARGTGGEGEGDQAAIAATMTKHGIAMPPQTRNLPVLPAQ